MNPIIDLLQKTRGTTFISEDGYETTFEFLPPLSGEELATFEATLPSPLPADIRELLQFARGCKGVLEEINFSDSLGFGMEEIFPHAISLAGDGFGNFWVVDLTSESKHWGPIFYACHDAPVIVYQSDDLLHFLKEAIRFENKPWKGEIDVHEEFSTRIWRENPGVLSHEQCLSSTDPNLKAFAQSLDETWEFIDLRKAKLGEGYSWGRYGSRTLNKRFREQRIFACQKKTLGQRFLGASGDHEIAVYFASLRLPFAVLPLTSAVATNLPHRFRTN
jgi:hypothetical protein